MKIIDCLQRSAEWYAARCGLPTASGFKKLVTPTGKPVTSDKRRTYMLELAGERLTGQLHPHYLSADMQRGIDLEPQAVAYYQLVTGRAVSRVGFVLGPDGRWGCSPDGVTEDGGMEVKCLGRAAHLDALDTGAIPDEYIMQVQGCMWIMQRRYWDFVLYTDEPNIPSAIWRIERNAELHAALEDCLPVFCDELDAMTKKIRGMQ
jgi:hypothetical protein